ncbi:MAG: TonB-dependent receptor [Capnocytophaga sp.]|nr:TonB-dependent receptor [Capnocytophaga sp.]
MIRYIFVFAFCLHGFTQVFSQQRHTISGYVSNSQNGEKLSYVAVFVPDSSIGTTTNEYGFYSLTLPAGSYALRIEYLGFDTIDENVNVQSNIQKNYSLQTSVLELEGIELQAQSSKANVRSPEISVVKIPVATIKKMPVVLGEVDILKSILLLPGVSNAGEGASGFNVRGGGADQNLILLDEATIFNASHLFGFFGIFNADAIRDITLYKGGIPARYGGRASSVLDIYQKEGNNQQLSANGGIGLLSSRLLLEGPIAKDKASFLIGGRSSYVHLFTKLFNLDNSAYFYDLNTKISYRLNEKNTFYASGYFGRDVFSLNQNFKNTYGNEFGNLRWNHLYSDKLFSNLSAIYSSYYYGFDLDFVGFSWISYIKNINLKYDLKHYASPQSKFAYGIQTIYHDFNPGEITPYGENSTISPDKLSKKYALETALYAEGEHKLSPKLSVAYGLRYSRFNRLGSETIHLYSDDQPVGYNAQQKLYFAKNPIDSISYGKHKAIDLFDNLEPRLSASYAFNDQQSVKIGYNRMAQYLHLISNTTSPTPLNVWLPSGRYIKPQLLDQIALGYASNLKNDRYSLEVEAFYRNVQNRADYIDGANLIANDHIERELLSGEMRAYGLEFYFRKNTGKLTGWISYTLSKAEQRIQGRTPEETGINYGNWYDTGYNKTHDLSVNAMYKLNERWDFAATFVAQSGLPATFPNAKYEYQGILIPNFGLRNTNRLPAYHRLDISATYTPQGSKNRRWKGEWTFGIYNLYNRMNAASVAFRQNAETGRTEAAKFSIFGIIPSATYNFKF